MSIRTRICQIVAVSILLLESLNLNVYSLECDDDRCKTGSCNSTGACICNLPDPSTILDGDRPFLGGKFCDEEMTICDGTNSFWCEHGGTCEEIVQGEKYSCKCPPGFAGKHCEYSGAPCGKIFCFHNAECLAEEAQGDVCQCPPEWNGSADCSLPTTTSPDSYSNSTATKLHKVTSSGDNDAQVTLAVLAVSSVGAVAAGAIYGKKLFCKKKRDSIRFQQLSEMSAQGVLLDDDDDDDDENHSVLPEEKVHGDISHL